MLFDHHVTDMQNNTDLRLRGKNETTSENEKYAHFYKKNERKETRPTMHTVIPLRRHIH